MKATKSFHCNILPVKQKIEEMPKSNGYVWHGPPQHTKLNGAMSHYAPASTLKAPLGPNATDKNQKQLVLGTN